MARFSAKVSVADDARLLLLKEVTELIAKAKSLDLPDTVYLLNVAQLDLQANIYDITDGEMDAFLNAARFSDKHH